MMDGNRMSRMPRLIQMNLNAQMKSFFSQRTVMSLVSKHAKNSKVATHVWFPNLNRFFPLKVEISTYCFQLIPKYLILVSAPMEE